MQQSQQILATALFSLLIFNLLCLDRIKVRFQEVHSTLKSFMDGLISDLVSDESIYSILLLAIMIPSKPGKYFG